MSPPRVPREKVPWHPKVDPTRCTGCRVCFEFCRYDVYEWDEAADRPVVAKPLHCPVGCSGCQPKCPAGAIAFPDLDETSALIRRLRAELKDGA
jgi:NAD-dependent dihydropyrimidine dehydrogenase PreA subunit